MSHQIMKSPLAAAAVVPAILAAVALGACKKSNAEAVELQKKAAAMFQPLPAKAPGVENDTAEQVALGEKLYHEKRLSANDKQSCASCHQLGKKAGVDNEPTSEGAFGKRGDRNSPTVLNAAFHTSQFWDGRAKDLVEQAKGPILNPVEMAMPNEKAVLEKLAKIDGYPAAFAKAFPNDKPALSYDNLAKAIAAFERTLVTSDRFDDFLKGDTAALKADELAGLKLFIDSGCNACHNGPGLGGAMFQKFGVVKPYKNKKDLGRFNVTKNAADKYVFKVATLRNVALTAPYFHDGAVKTLPQAVKTMAVKQLGKKLTNDEAAKIAAFLGALSDKKLAAAK